MAGRRTYRTRAIVLDRTKLAEQDLILTLLAADGSQVRAVAKGARKPGGRLAARVELFCETDFLLAAGRSLDVVSEAQTVEPHAALRGDYERVAAASAVAEVARLTCYEDAPDGFLHPICSRALRACEGAADRAHLDLVVAAYAMKVLAHGGWRPELAGCCACGDQDVSYFSAAAGGVLCASCAREVAGARELSRSEVSWLRALLGLTFDELLVVQIDAETAVVLLGAAHVWAATHLDARLCATEFYLGL
ncbi:DNA repair protein RecO [Olsenella sp. DSM 107455]|uniref:DNA repair protein RecO n=1 Tax=Thermophilibacter gallinarum TaxID=2779357 RepID=A0ABR9QU68_9ACTN|nr:DNA repair protein RecO [Thermophilibacter gallinarum]